MKAVHFGAGNIGRGFVAEFLHKTGYEVVFADVVDSIIDALKAADSFDVTEIGTEGVKVSKITNFRAINSKTHEAEVVGEIATADIVTSAVGPNILKFIAPVIAKGIEARDTEAQKAPLAVIACENAIGATDQLAGHIKEPQNTPEARLGSIHERARFANSAIDRIVPGQDPDQGLNVKLEAFFEWVVEKLPFEPHGHPEIWGVHWVRDLTPYIERKLYTVNTSHAAAAYYGHVRGKKTIHDALMDRDINHEVHQTVHETSKIMHAKHDIDPAEQAEYVSKIITRISNPHLEDYVERVGRAPLRKLSRKERFIGPAAELLERGESAPALLRAIDACLRFQNVEGDEESVELAKILTENDAREATLKITELETTHPLFDKVVEVVERVKKET